MNTTWGEGNCRSCGDDKSELRAATLQEPLAANDVFRGALTPFFGNSIGVIKPVEATDVCYPGAAMTLDWATICTWGLTSSTLSGVAGILVLVLVRYNRKLNTFWNRIICQFALQSILGFFIAVPTVSWPAIRRVPQAHGITLSVYAVLGLRGGYGLPA